MTEPEATSAAPNYAADEGRTNPSFLNLISPPNIWGWIWSFLDCWFHSREVKLFFTAIPFLVTGVGGAAFVWWLETSPKNELVATYEQAVDEAIKNEDIDKQSIYLESLVRLRPDNMQYRFHLARHLAENDQRDRAIQQFQVLTTPGRQDYAPARLWLVSQAQTENPLIPLTAEQIEGQLLQALELQPKNTNARRAMADLLAKKGQLTGAEHHLLSVIDDNPGLTLALAKIQKMLGRSDEQINIHLATAISHNQKLLLEQPYNPKVRLSLADAFVLMNQYGEAERVLAEGLADKEVPELTRGLANLYFGISAARIRKSVLNRDSCIELLLKAIKLAPDNPAYLKQAVAFSSIGGQYPEGSLDGAIDALRQKEAPTVEDKVLLVRALATNGELESAIEILKPLSETKPDLKTALAELLRAAGRTTELDALTKQLIDETKVDERATASISQKLKFAEILLLSLDDEKAFKLLEASKPENEEASEAEVKRWNQLFGTAAIRVYDQKMKAEKFTDFADALELLDKALKTNSVSFKVLERLVAVSCSESNFAAAADDALNTLLATGVSNPDIYNLIGSQALEADQANKAKRYLEKAYRLSRRNPMILNNLALSLIRDNTSDPERALELTEDALELLPDHPDVLSTRAEVFIAMERWEDARRDLEVSLPKRPKSVNCHRLLAQVCDKMGDDSLAEKHRKLMNELEASAVE